MYYLSGFRAAFGCIRIGVAYGLSTNLGRHRCRPTWSKRQSI